MSSLERTPDFEIKKILQCLKTNGYEFTGIKKSNDWQGDMIGSFKKDVHFDKDYEDVNDSHISIKVEFDSRMDTEHSYYDEEGEYIPNLRRGGEFISNLFDEFAGGKRKSKKNKSRKTRKNRRR